MNLPVGPWAILRTELEKYADVDEADLFAEVDAASADEMYAARAAANQRQGSIAVVPVLGPITKRDTLLTMIFGGTSTNRLVSILDTLRADPSVSAVVLNVDSPGGTISGLPEAAAAIRRLRDEKPVIAISNDLAASAAYWLASQADEIVGTPESLTGSVGVYLMHADVSGMLAQAGIDVTFIASSPEKVEGNPYEPLTDGARAHLQGIVDSSYDLFTKDVAAGRGITQSKVKRDYGEGRVLTAAAALEAGIIDRIGTYADAISIAASGSRLGPRAEANADAEPVESESAGEVLEENAILPSLDRWRFSR